MLVAKSGKNIPLEFSEERRKDEVLDTVADISLAQREIDWYPNICFFDKT